MGKISPQNLQYGLVSTVIILRASEEKQVTYIHFLIPSLRG